MSHHHRSGKRKAFQRRTAPGTSPGVITPHPNSPQPVIRMTGYGPDKMQEKVIHQVEELRAALDKWPVLWIDVDALGNAEVVEKIGEIFDLHRLALEDVVNTHQRAKVDEFEDRLFVVTHMVQLNSHLETEQVSLFLGPNFVVTFQERPGDVFDPVRKRLRESKWKIRKSGADYLAYALLDAVVDGYYPVLETLGERLDHLEDELLQSAQNGVMTQVHTLKRELLVLRRLTWPLREALARLMREETPLIESVTRMYLRDCYDHVVQLVDLVETFRELTVDLRDFHMNTVNNRINETMRVLTIIATIFIPLTFITSVYGMNFDTKISPYNMPELEWEYGYPAVWAVMGLTTIGLLIYFWWQGWIWSGSREEN